MIEVGKQRVATVAQRKNHNTTAHQSIIDYRNKMWFNKFIDLHSLRKHKHYSDALSLSLFRFTPLRLARK